MEEKSIQIRWEEELWQNDRTAINQRGEKNWTQGQICKNEGK